MIHSVGSYVQYSVLNWRCEIQGVKKINDKSNDGREEAHCARLGGPLVRTPFSYTLRLVVRRILGHARIQKKDGALLLRRNIQYSIIAVHHGRLSLHRLRSTGKNKFVNGVRSRCWSWHSRRCNSREDRYSSMAKVHTAKGRRRSHELLQRRFRGQDGSHRSESYSGYQVCIILVDIFQCTNKSVKKPVSPVKSSKKLIAKWWS